MFISLINYIARQSYASTLSQLDILCFHRIWKESHLQLILEYVINTMQTQNTQNKNKHHKTLWCGWFCREMTWN